MKLRSMLLLALALGCSPAFAQTTEGTSPLSIMKGGTNRSAPFTSGLPVLGNGSGPLAQGTRSGNTTSFATTNGFLTPGDCLKVDTNGNLTDSGAGCGANSNTPHTQDFLATANFTPGTTTSLTLSSTPASSDMLIIAFDGVWQNINTWSLAGAVITFSAPIPLNTQVVEAKWSSSNTLAGVGSLNSLFGALTVAGVGINVGAAGSTLTLTNASQVCYVDGVHFANLAAAVASCTSNTTIVVQSAQTISTDVVISGHSIIVKCENGATITAANATSRLFFSGTNSAVDGCSLIGPGTGAPSYQAIVSQGDGFSLRNSRISNWGTTGQNGTVEVICGSHINITGNQIFDNADAGLFVGTACNIDDVRITNNRIGNGVVLHASSGAATLSNVIVSNNTLSSGDHSNISFCFEYGVFGGTSATLISVTGNTCRLRANGTNGGFSFSTVNYFTAAGNTFDAAGFTYTVAAFEAGTSSVGSFVGNTVKSAGVYAFSCAVCSNISYSGNTVDSFGATLNDTAFFLYSSGTSGFLNVTYTGNTVNFAAGAAGKAFQANCGNASAVCGHIGYVGNTIVSDGTANSIGVDIIRTAGTMDGFLIGPNAIIGPSLGVRILPGVTHICLAPGLNVTATPITNGGSASSCI